MPTSKGSPPEGCGYYESVEDVPEKIQKYWYQRYNLFSKYDEGIWLTHDAWYGVTPEPVANAIAAHMAESAPPQKKAIIDAFAGVGGNAIAFAKSGRWEVVFAIEKDPATLKCAKHNAEIYGVSKKIFWIQGDCFGQIKKSFAKNDGGKAFVLFGSPPWGGPEYQATPEFDLSAMQPYSLKYLHAEFTRLTPDVALFLPRTSDYNQLADLTTDEKKPLEVIHYCMKGASKALCVYFGNFGPIEHKTIPWA